MKQSSILEAYQSIYKENTSTIGQGHYYNVYDQGDMVKKMPKDGGRINEKELQKLQFMKDNEASKAFVKIYEITPTYVLTEKVTLIDRFLYMWAKESNDETNDIDILSDWVADFFSNKKNWKDHLDWLQWHIDDKENWYDETFKPHPRFLSDPQKLMVITKCRNLLAKMINIEWPFNKLDIHASNVGLNRQNDLVIFDL